ncbi:MAG: DUF6159 family protein, partial [Actinomycetota bacterium]
MGSISRGFRLAKQSWYVVMQERSLLVLPVLSFLCILLVAGAFGGGAFGMGLFDDATTSGSGGGGSNISPVAYVLLFCFYVITSFIAIYFNAVVIGVAMKRLHGEDASLGDGFALANQHLGKIFVWAVVTATVGMVLRMVAERAGFLGAILIRLVGVAWGLITFFVVPVILYEPLGVGASIKRSASLFKQKWGEQVVGNATIGLAMFVAGIGVALVCAGIGFAIPAAIPAVVVVGVLALIVLAALGSVLSGVFNAALYRYATTGDAGGAFSEQDLAGSFRPKKGLRGNLA